MPTNTPDNFEMNYFQSLGEIRKSKRRRQIERNRSPAKTISKGNTPSIARLRVAQLKTEKVLNLILRTSGEISRTINDLVRITLDRADQAAGTRRAPASTT